jgi:hypothetical protein
MSRWERWFLVTLVISRYPSIHHDSGPSDWFEVEQ